MIALDFCLGVLSAVVLMKLFESLDFNYKLKSFTKTGKPRALILNQPSQQKKAFRKVEENWDENIEFDEGVTAIKKAELTGNGPIVTRTVR